MMPKTTARVKASNLGLLGGGGLAGADGPDGLVGEDDARPVGDVVGDGLELPEAHLLRLARLPLLQLLADARQDLGEDSMFVEA